MRRRRNPCLRGTVAWGTVARSRTPGEVDVSLCEEVVLGLITCEGEVLVIRPHLLSENAQGYLLLNLREEEGQEEVLEDKDEEEEETEVDEKVKEVRGNAQLMHATW